MLMKDIYASSLPSSTLDLNGTRTTFPAAQPRDPNHDYCRISQVTMR